MKQNLTEKESTYLSMAIPKNGVVYLEGRPGEGKSSIIKSIAKKTNHRFIDIRLSQMDETDIGLFPVVDEKDQCLNYVVPRWAKEANKQPSIILFDELNRAQLPIRNAALQILLDRKIGWDFEFNDDVLMFSAGNMGEEDGCDVEEFDGALWGRLIHVKHSLTLDEWVEAFAKDNVWDVIVSFLKAKPEYLYKKSSDNTKVYASHRSWTFLSDFIKSKYPDLKDVNLTEVRQTLEKVGCNYIGNSITCFLRYIEDMSIINANDILSRFDQVKSQVEEFNRCRLSELMSSIKDMNFVKFKPKQIENLKKFVSCIQDDEAVSYLIHLVDKYETETIKPFIQSFPELRILMRKNYKVE